MGKTPKIRLQPTGSSSDTARLSMMYDGSGRRISKTVMRKVAGAADWDTAQVTHYTGIGTEIRENYAGPAKETKVVVNMPQGLGRYGIEDAENPDMGSGAGYIPNAKFEWYLKNHLGSTMLVYGTQADANPAHSDIGTTLAAYDYRAFGEMVELTPPPTGKVTENFTGKEHDDEIALDYFGARYLDPMLGMWTSVDPARQFASPYLYAGNGMNPIGGIDPSGMFFEDGERCTEGMFVDATTNQGHVDPDVFDDLVLAHNNFMSVLNDILTAAAYTEGEYGGETSFWIKDGSTKNWATTPPGTPEITFWGGSGLYFHTHLERGSINTGLEGLSRADKAWRGITYPLSAFEVTSGRIFYYNPNFDEPKNINIHPNHGFLGYDIMQIPKQKYWIDPQNYWNHKPTLPPKTFYFTK